jgi:archaellum biogenesis protein FlaJ (TadC family)
VDLFNVVCLALSLANLSGLAVAVFYKSDPDEPKAASLQVRCGTGSALLLAVSQVLYLVFVMAWFFRWMRFYPGAPLPFACGVSGLALSIAGLLAALFAPKLQCYIGVAVGLTLSFLWLIGLAVSVAV